MGRAWSICPDPHSTDGISIPSRRPEPPTIDVQENPRQREHDEVEIEDVIEGKVRLLRGRSPTRLQDQPLCEEKRIGRHEAGGHIAVRAYVKRRLNLEPVWSQSLEAHREMTADLFPLLPALVQPRASHRLEEGRDESATPKGVFSMMRSYSTRLLTRRVGPSGDGEERAIQGMWGPVCSTDADGG